MHHKLKGDNSTTGDSLRNEHMQVFVITQFGQPKSIKIRALQRLNFEKKIQNRL